MAHCCRICAVGCGTWSTSRAAGWSEWWAIPTTPGPTASPARRDAPGAEFHHAADRLDVPAIRRDGMLTPVSWAEALDDIAALTAGIVAEHGPLAVAHYVGTGGPLDPAGYAMGHGFFRALGTDQHYSALSIDCSGKALVPAARERRAAHVPTRSGAGVAAPRHRREHRAVPRPRPHGLEPDRASCASCGPAAARSW